VRGKVEVRAGMLVERQRLRIKSAYGRYQNLTVTSFNTLIPIDRSLLHQGHRWPRQWVTLIQTDTQIDNIEVAKVFHISPVRRLIGPLPTKKRSQ
jgi:hypothetical protein